MIVRLATGLYLGAFQRLPKVTGIEETTSQITVKEKSIKTIIPFSISLCCLCCVLFFFFKYSFNNKTYCALINLAEEESAVDLLLSTTTGLSKSVSFIKALLAFCVVPY